MSKIGIIDIANDTELTSFLHQKKRKIIQHRDIC